MITLKLILDKITYFLHYPPNDTVLFQITVMHCNWDLFSIPLELCHSKLASRCTEEGVGDGVAFSFSLSLNSEERRN